jgi:ATP-dependent Clp protease ATP-binding subunit ClpC
MYERYNEESRRVVFFSLWEARQAGSSYIEPKHLFLGLTHDSDSKANKLFGLAAHAESFRQQFASHGSAKPSTSGDLPLSNTSKRVLAYTAEEADNLASRLIGTEHLLLGLLREKSSDVPAALAVMGINLHSARNRISQECKLPLLDGKPQHDTSSRKKLRPLGAFFLLVLSLSLLYLIFRLVKS